MKTGDFTTESVRWERTGHLYWLGYVFMRLLHILQQGEPDAAMILHGLEQARYHAAQLNLDARILERLDDLRQQAGDVDEWTVLNRNTIILDVGALAEIVADLAERQQGQYRGYSGAT